VYRRPVLTTPNYRRLIALLAGAAVVPAMLGACTSSSTTTTTTTTTGATTGATGQQRATSVCSLVTTAQIKQTLGKTVHAPRVANSPRSTVCTYPSNVAADTVIVGFRAKVTEADAGLEQARIGRLHGTVTDVSGTGFTAYYYSDTSVKPPVIGLVTINGKTQVTVTSTAPLAQQETLTQQIFATLASQASGATTTTPTTAAP